MQQCLSSNKRLGRELLTLTSLLIILVKEHVLAVGGRHAAEHGLQAGADILTAVIIEPALGIQLHSQHCTRMPIRKAGSRLALCIDTQEQQASWA